MSIYKNKRDGTFYISYYYKNYLGSVRRRNIYNKDWTYSIGINYMRSIEQEVIAKDTEKLKLIEHDDNATFDDVLSKFLEEYSQTYKEQTAYNYKTIANKHLVGLRSTTNLFSTQTTQEKIIRWLKYIDNQTFSVKRKNRIKTLVKNLLQFAYERSYISSEQLRQASIVIKKTKENKEIKKEKEFWTKEEYDNFISTFEKNDKWAYLFNTCYWGALRVGELLALTWNDIDFDNKMITINKQMSKNGKITSTKTTSSNMTVALPSAIINSLKTLKEELHATNEQYMFFVKPTSRTTMRKIMNEHIKMAGLKHITIHGLRHSMASYMINKGVDILLISKHLRHSSTQMTYDTYCHLFPNRNKDVMEKLFD